MFYLIESFYYRNFTKEFLEEAKRGSSQSSLKFYKKAFINLETFKRPTDQVSVLPLLVYTFFFWLNIYFKATRKGYTEIILK